MKTILNPFIERGELAGAVTLIADRNGVLDVNATGWADLENRLPMREDTLFWIASQTKTLTAAAFMMLVDEGKARVEDPVERHLPEFKEIRVEAERREDGTLILRKPASPLTLRHLLSHTSGLPFRSFMEEPIRDVLPLEYGVRGYIMTPLAFEPGSKYQYSNCGLNTIGRVIEAISGQSYESFLRERLLDPLGMTDTVFRPDLAQINRLAKAYMPGPGGLSLVETTMTQYTRPFTNAGRQPVPGGGLFSTAADVSRFCRMLLRQGELDGKRYLSGAAVAEMSRKQTGAAVDVAYGLGCETGGGCFGHGGAFSTFMKVYPAKNRVLVFLVQHNGFPGKGAEASRMFIEHGLKL